ncbi:MAG: tRNA (guanosine(46)-N7)-methyltransferase TrmB [Bacteroidales bacterium]|nr:tRNA (guanosine(46)-N7)-methyltransferase TrmB [Bacteroidales bacterium]
MGHGKLKKFKENETFKCLLQPDAASVMDKTEDNSGLVLKDHPIKGQWASEMFAAANPLVVELGCGKGEYTIDLARRNPDFNYVGVDIKGARLWKGAKEATETAMPNVAFLRTRVEFIEAFFAPSEVSEIWLTFSDPQMKSENCRLTSPLFLKRYRNILKKGGIIHLKTDSMFLHQYSKAIAEQNGLRILACTEDLYGTDRQSLYESEMASVCGKDAIDALFGVRTFYENMFLSQGYKITYLSFVIDKDGDYIYPEFDAKYWREVEGPRRSFGHHRGGTPEE